MEKYSRQLSNAGRLNSVFFKKISFIFERQHIVSIVNGNGKKHRILVANSISTGEHKLLETF